MPTQSKEQQAFIPDSHPPEFLHISSIRRSFKMLPQTILLLLSGASLAVCSPIASSAGKLELYVLMILQLICEQRLLLEPLTLLRRSVLHLLGPLTPMKPMVIIKGNVLSTPMKPMVTIKGNVPSTPMKPMAITRERNVPYRMPMKSRVTIKESGPLRRMPTRSKVIIHKIRPLRRMLTKPKVITRESAP